MGSDLHGVLDRILSSLGGASAPSLEAKRRHEQSKYDKIYAGGGTYGTKEHWRVMRNDIAALDIKSLCDVGTGNGNFPRLMGSRGARPAVGVDFAMPSKWEVDTESLVLKRASAHDLPLSDGEVQYVTAFDMLEHLLPEEVDPVLEEFARVASKGFVFTIATKPSRRLVDGETLHPTVQSTEWWKRAIGRVTGFAAEQVGEGVICHRT